MSVEPFAAVLLAGGHSRRMGRDKAMLALPDGRLLWERQLDILRELEPAELVISGYKRPGFPPEVRIVPDITADSGPLGGIVAAFLATQAERLVVLPIDLPALTCDYLAHLLSLGEDHRGIVPFHPGPPLFFEPLVAIYPRASLPIAERNLLAQRRSMHAFIDDCGALLAHRSINLAEQALFANWNEPVA